MIKSSERGHAASANGNNGRRNYADRLKDQPCGSVAVGARRKHICWIFRHKIYLARLTDKEYGYLGDVLIFNGALFFSRFFTISAGIFCLEAVS